MSTKTKSRYLLFVIPLVVNITILASGLALAPTLARTDQVAAAALANDPTPPPESPIEESALGGISASTLPKSSFVITPTIYLKSREFQPSSMDALGTQRLQQIADEGRDRVHVLVQLDFIPREAARVELAARGLKLLAYVPDNAWIASVSTTSPETALALPGVIWAGELTVDDKLDQAIQANQWGTWNLTPDGQVAVYLALHKDESLETGRKLVKNYGGQVTGEVTGINLLIVEMPRDQIRALAAEDAVQWIEPAAPPLGEANDGIRDQIGVNTVNAAPYNLDGSGIDVLVYDSGQVGNHSGFTGRLIHGDGDTVSEHSTHVAGTVGGDGSNSTNLQWRGMAPAVDLISYGTGYSGSGITFYENVPDIQADWAAAQNTYGADLGTASLGSNIYAYFPSDCWVMGNYGASSVLIDQIVRGGNAAVGIGDKYIAAWAAGNERGWGTSCPGLGGGYGLVAPPAGAKNPIHVGGSNTNNNTQYAHTSWGPTDDGRLKPIVTAGACQTTGDLGITSTDDNPANGYTTKCGTSMATPAVSGGIALMLQHYRDVYNTSGNFWPSTAKAILMHTAADFGNPGPDYQWGYGQVDIQAAVDLISRKAFRQDSVAHGGVDVFYFIVPNDTAPATVTLAWDDYEATFNANPTLINNLNLELVAPDGTIWRPWVLNPASPTANATRGVDNINNQEQVQVPAPQVGTWMVRVKGTSVPQGPQDYALVCEGCQPLNVGVCQVAVSGAAMAAVETENLRLEENVSDVELPSVPPAHEIPSIGELWQRSLEAQSTSGINAQRAKEELQLASAALETARQEGPEAVVALLEVLKGEALDMVMDEIDDALEQIAENSPPPPETNPVSAAEELARLEAQQAIEAINRARALTNIDDSAEGQASGPIFQPQLASPSTPSADRTVGSGCTYPTIAAAITAANPGDRLLIEGGVTFTENLIVNKNLTLLGGYNGCASGSTARTVIDGNASGSVIDIAAGINITMQNLDITNGSTGVEGGGIRFAIGAGTGTLTLTNMDVYANSGYWGGGIWLGPDTDLVASNVDIYNNMATLYGGGLRLYGSRATLNDSNIYNNSAPIGGGVYGTQESGFSAELNLPSSADIYDNQALTGGALGGGVYLRQGAMTVADCSDIYSNAAMDGGGAYLITSTITINGSCSEIQNNTATGNGGGVYAQGSMINLDDDAELYDNDAGTDTTGSGGGAYLDNSNLYSDKGSILYNNTEDYGAGIYATNGSIVDMDLGSYPCVGERCSRLYGNIAANNYGGGIYANDSAVWLDNIFIENNGANLGGAIYATNSSMNIYNSLFARNNATSTAGDAIRLYTSATMLGRGNTFAYNDSGGASTGRAIDAFSADLTLQCSIVWGHSSNISPTGLDVSYSDIQGAYDGVGNLNVNPLFVASGSYDYHLQSGSPTIDRCPSLSGLATDFDNEVRPVVRVTAATPYDMGADEATVDRVGINGACTYGTIQQAVNAASNGDTIQISTGVYFETVDIASKNITLAGGYDSTCTSITGGATRLEGSTGTSSALDVTNSTVTIQNLDISWGQSTGAGIDARSGASVTLDNTDVYNNHGSSGGGIYVSSDSIVSTNNNSEIHDNTASTMGGGVGVWGQFSGNGNYSDIYQNCAPHGGGFYVPGGSLSINSADTYLNQAADANGLGGGIYLTNSGAVTLTNGAYVYYLNQAYNGAGIYADNAQVYLNGGATTLRDNIAANHGGAVYLTNGSTLHSSGARIGQAGSSLANEALLGAGIYAQGSTVDFDGGYIINNIAASSGGGIYADNSTISLTGVQVGDTAAYYANQLGSSGHFGAGLYLTGATQATLDNTIVAGNLFQTTGFTYGGGAYVSSNSALTLTNNSRIQEHTAPSVTDGRGAGIYINNGTVTIDNSQMISNTAGTVGGGIRMLGSSVLNVLNGSLINNNEALNGEGGGLAAGGTPDINISNATLQDNTASTHGGAIYLDSGTLDFSGGWKLQGNTAGGNGGAVAVLGTADSRFVAGAYSLVYFNRALGGNGGMVYLHNNTTSELHATTGAAMYVYANSASENGGALFADNSGYFDIYGQVNFDRNRADNGGAIYLSNSSTLWMDDYSDVGPALWDNWADTGSGGAIYAQNSPRVECDGATLGRTGEGNHASLNGGAIYLSGSTLDAENCTFLENQAANHGGAIAAEASSALTLDANFVSTLASPTPAETHSPEAPQATGCDPAAGPCSAFIANLADSDANSSGYGGAIYLNASTLQLDATVLQGNQAVRGGAIYQTGSSSSQLNNDLLYANAVSTALGAGIRSEGGTFALSHVTLANNNSGAAFSQSSTTSSVINSIAWGNTAGGFLGTFTAPTCNIDQSANAGLNLDPHFVAAGAGENYHLFGDSPAIDACTTGLTTDLDGIIRPFGSGYDMGAFEYAAGISFSPNHSESGLPGSPVSYVHTLTNAGGGTDTYTLSATSSQGWSVMIDSSPTVTLAGGQSATVTVTVNIPAGAAADTFDTTVVSATSGLDPSLSASVSDTTTVIQVWHHIYLPLIVR